MSHSRSRSRSPSSGKHHVYIREQVGGRQAGGEQSSSGQGSDEQARHGQALYEQAGGEYVRLHRQASLQQELHEQGPHQQTRHEISTGETITAENITGENTIWGQARLGDKRASSHEVQMANEGVAHYAGGSSSSILDDAASHEGEDIRTFIPRSVGPKAALADEQALYDTSDDLGLDVDEHHAGDGDMGHNQGDQEDYDQNGNAMDLDQGNQDDYDENDRLVSHYTASGQDDDEDDGAMQQGQVDQANNDADDNAMEGFQDGYDQNDYEKEEEGVPVLDHSPNDASEDEFGEDIASQQDINLGEDDSDSDNERNSASSMGSEYDSNNITVRPRAPHHMLGEYRYPHPSMYAYSGDHKKAKHHHTVSGPDEEGSLHSDSSLSELGSTPPPPNLALLAIERARALAKWPLCKCAGWCSCERYTIFIGDGEEALKCYDPAEKDDLCFPSQTHLPEHVLAGEQHPLSAMRTTTDPINLGGSIQTFSWDSLPKPRRAPVSWVGGEWKAGYLVPAVEDAPESE